MPKAKKQPTKQSKSPLTFNHAMVYVRDTAVALRFYRDLLGFKLIDESPGYYARLRSPGGRATIALHRFEPGQPADDSGAIRLYFETQNLDALCRRLAAAGVEFTQMPKRMPWGWKHAYLNDPDGHELSLYWAGEKRFRKTL